MQAAPHVGCGMLALETFGNRVEFRLRLRDRHAWPKPSEHIEIAMATLHGILGRNEGFQYVGAVPEHVRWEHSDHRD